MFRTALKGETNIHVFSTVSYQVISSDIADGSDASEADTNTVLEANQLKSLQRGH